jgi:hypothetical protein
MGIKQWFGKSLVSLIQDTQVGAYPSEVRQATEMERMFGNCSPAVVAFKIENGFVVRTVSQAELYEGKRQSGFHYCKDHIEIAEHIIASETKRKLGIDEEYLEEHYAAEKARAVAMQGGFAKSKRATTRT